MASDLPPFMTPIERYNMLEKWTWAVMRVMEAPPPDAGAPFALSLESGQVRGDLSVGGHAALTGNTTLADATVEGTTTLGNASVGGTLGVTGNTTLANNTSVGGTLGTITTRNIIIMGCAPVSITQTSDAKSACKLDHLMRLANRTDANLATKAESTGALTQNSVIVGAIMAAIVLVVLIMNRPGARGFGGGGGGSNSGQAPAPAMAPPAYGYPVPGPGYAAPPAGPGSAAPVIYNFSGKSA
eukprot:tig00000681_g3150.t1